ncbi:GTP cyclohydrolase I FolE [Pseudobdellovibrio exovorus]|uniref:GTP cyclohydrolase 1 n=1 Tax=Pseudobdellovibrio exovorus JSS TaxID=1184267 RepID=M4V705_9BACT|nr:GTP cyclohydrolase I FolE [Pseudobdellovibrio exovorus]AGH95167.1 GTP cyclohydrolase I [Pseudobdellovibrio exovorus JSS]
MSKATNKSNTTGTEIALEILTNVRPSPTVTSNLSDEEKISTIQKHFSEIMKVLGLDLEDDSLKDTPKRMAKMYVNEIFGGLSPQNFPKITVIENKMQYDQMVCVQDIEVMSVCEHHFQPIDGFATVAYIPKNKVIGLSKLNRIVSYFAKRPQVQERLTKQVADCLQYILDTEDVAVHINAKHYCVISRGIQDTHSTTTTSDLRGAFKSSESTRLEFLKQCRSRFNNG